MLAKIDWTAFSIIGTLAVSLLGALFGLYQARKADRSATTTKTIELGVKDLIDQYQERQRELKEDVAECNARCSALSMQAESERAKLQEALIVIGELRSEISRLEALTGD